MKNLIILIALFALCSCTKEKINTEVTFRFIDQITDTPVEGLDVRIHASNQSHITGSTIDIIDRVFTTDHNGEMNFEQYSSIKNWSYRIESPYFENSKDNYDRFQGLETTEVVDVIPLAKVKITIVDDPEKNFHKVRITSRHRKNSEDYRDFEVHETTFLPVSYNQEAEITLAYHNYYSPTVYETMIVNLAHGEEHELEIGI